MLEGNCELVGVAGRTLTLECGERPGFSRAPLLVFDAAGEAREAEDVEDALECECTWCMLRTEDTDEDVDLRPRRPALPRR